MNLSKLSLKELQNLKYEVDMRIRNLSHSHYKVGMEVGVDHPNHIGDVFTIVKVNRVKCEIADKDGKRFNCPRDMLSLI